MKQNQSSALVTHKITLTGLSCADCAEKLEHKLAALPGVASVQLNFLASTLMIEHTAPLEAIQKTIAEAGYGSEVVETSVEGMVTSYLRITGLDCPDCSASLTTRLQHTDGIDGVELNFSAALLSVQHRIPLSEVMHIIEDTGYGARPVSDIAAPSVKGGFISTHQRLITTATSGFFLVLAWVLSLFAGMPFWVPTVLYLAAILVGGYWTFLRGWSSVKSRMVDMNVLMSIAVTGAVLIGQWNEGATVAFLYSISNMLEAYTLERTRRSLRSLVEEAPREALVRRNGHESLVPVEQLHIDDLVIIKAAEKIPVDGIVMLGSSSVNQAPITGESLPVEKGVGDDVYAGTLNEHGVLEVRVAKLTEDTALAKIIHQVEEAQTRRAPAQAFIDRFARIYTPAVLAVAVLLAVIPPLFTHNWMEWFYRALMLVVVACPCALVISTPVAIVAAIGNAAHHGVLIKGGAYLEQAGRLSVIAFDKTGTLTKGRPDITDVITLNGVSGNELLAIAGAVESRSPHPLAEAVMRKTREAQLTLPEAESCVTVPGKGAHALVAGQQTYVGNIRLFEEMGIEAGVAYAKIDELQREGKTPMLVGTQEKILGILAAADQVRHESRATIRALHDSGIQQVVMLTGDHQGPARRIAAELGVDDYRAELLPDEKVGAIQELMHQTDGVGMVGDGINDAPALATATLGIAMGVAGTDTALETADIALMADDLCKLPYTIRLSRQALRIIRQNIALSLIIKAVAIALIFAGYLTLWLAVLADMGASLLVTLNGLRLVGERPLAMQEAHGGHGCEG